MTKARQTKHDQSLQFDSWILRNDCGVQVVGGACASCSLRHVLKQEARSEIGREKLVNMNDSFLSLMISASCKEELALPISPSLLLSDA